MSDLTHIRAMPVLQVRDMEASIAFYERLGIRPFGTWERPSTFAIIQRGHITIGLEQVTAPPDTSGAWSAYLYVADADAIHAEFVAAGVAIDRPVMDRTFGCRDFELSDPDGHRIAFGTPLQPSTGPGPGLREVTA